MLLIGYFLISSVNASGTFNELLTQNIQQNTTASIVGDIFKKIFKCDGCPEELEEYDAKTKSEKADKGLLLIDYIVPGHFSVTDNHINITSKDKAFIINSVLIAGFNSKIHLPPPEIKL